MTKPLRPTSHQFLGPFYPLSTPTSDGDLTQVEGGTGVAEGQVLYLCGPVVDITGAPVANKKVEIWQTNSHGRYTHPNDDNSAPLDPNFEGFAAVHTDNEGRYSLKTVKPGAYPTGPNSIRPSHIHFEVYARSKRFVTPMYFEGDPYHDQDAWLQSSRNQDTIIMPPRDPIEGMEPKAKRVEFDIVLRHG
ncbi:protocatechuate 3,4-dioxygenase [Alphaproteobacteria bacterium]|nr:protocatechuate 3,4-dioxygenase [Alphaproteobacteria bacterium]